MRLIDADALIDEIKHKLWDWESVDGITATTVLKQTITDIENQPTAMLKEQEAVEPLTIDDAVSEIMDKHYKRLKEQEAVELLMEGKVPMEKGSSGSETAEGKSTMSALEAVVYCGDCKHGSLYCTEDVCGETLIECNHPELGDTIAIHAWDWFCADGVRRE